LDIYFMKWKMRCTVCWNTHTTRTTDLKEDAKLLAKCNTKLQGGRGGSNGLRCSE